MNSFNNRVARNKDEGARKSARTLSRLNQLTGVLTILLILVVGLMAFKFVTEQFDRPKTYYEDQLQYWNQVLAKKPKDSLARTRVAQIHIKMGQVDRAVGELNAVLKDDPKYMAAYYYLGMAFQNQGQTLEAEKNLLKAIKLTKNDKVKVQPAYRLATIYEEKGNIAGAIKYYELAARGEPLLWNPQFKLGQLYEKKGSFEKALSHYEEAAKFNPSNEIKQAIGKLKGKLNAR